MKIDKALEKKEETPEEEEEEAGDEAAPEAVVAATPIEVPATETVPANNSKPKRA